MVVGGSCYHFTTQLLLNKAIIIFHLFFQIILRKSKMALIQWIKEKSRGYRKIRIAIMGSRLSGKTVLLTALANHLREHNPEFFPVGNWKICWDKNAILGNDTIKQKVLLPKKDFSYYGTENYLDLGNYRTNYGIKNSGLCENILKAENNSQCLFELGLRNYPKMKVKS